MKTYVILSGTPFNSMNHRVHHLTKYLANKGRVLYFYLGKSLILTKEEFSEFFLENNGEYLAENPMENVYVFETIKKLADDKLSFEGTDVILKRIENYYTPEQTVFYVTNPRWIDYFANLSGSSSIIYDCIDDWDGFVDENIFGNRLTPAKEKKIATIADVVLCSSKRLCVKMSNYNQNIFYIPNGVEIKTPHSNDIPLDLVNIPKPIVFFMGMITNWVDIQLIDFISERRPDYSFVFVGPSFKVELPKRDNIYDLGEKKYEKLSPYLSSVDIGIIPFKNNKISAAVSPLKFFEYISTGLPVVTTVFPELTGVPGAHIAYNYSEFLTNMDKLICLEDETKLQVKDALYNTSKEYEWSLLFDTFFLDFENGSVQNKMNNIELLVSIMNEYLPHKDKSGIRNELMTIYNLLERYDDSIEIGEELLVEGYPLDLNQLALAYIRAGNIEKGVKYLISYKNSLKNPLGPEYQKYIEYLLSYSVKNELILALALKESFQHYEAINLLKSLDNNHIAIKELLATILLDLDEINLAGEFYYDALLVADTTESSFYVNPYSISLYINSLIGKFEFDKARQWTNILYDLALSDLANEIMPILSFSESFYKSGYEADIKYSISPE